MLGNHSDHSALSKMTSISTTIDEEQQQQQQQQQQQDGGGGDYTKSSSFCLRQRRRSSTAGSSSATVPPPPCHWSNIFHNNKNNNGKGGSNTNTINPEEQRPTTTTTASSNKNQLLDDEEKNIAMDDNDDDDNNKNNNCTESFLYCLPSCCNTTITSFRTLHQNPWILLVSLLIFLFIGGLGYWFVTHQVGDAYQDRMFVNANGTAQDALQFFRNEFDRALAPLFALSQVVKHDEELCRLSQRIGNRYELEPTSMNHTKMSTTTTTTTSRNGSEILSWNDTQSSNSNISNNNNLFDDLDNDNNNEQTTTTTTTINIAPVLADNIQKRDTTGICDNPQLLQRFATIAESVQRDSGLGHVISGLRLAPAGVMCLIHPLINYVDYAHVLPATLDESPSTTTTTSSLGTTTTNNNNNNNKPYYNGTKWLQYDWGWGRPGHIDVLRKTYERQEATENRITITGPFRMKSATGDGTILTETLFCTHLGVTVPNHTATMISPDGTSVDTYEGSWGFVMGFVNWALLVDESNINERFRDLEMVYMLNRTYDKLNHETGEIVSVTNRIAWSHERCVTTTPLQHRIRIETTVNGDHWVLVAGYTCPTMRPPWEWMARVILFVVATLMALLTCQLCIKQQQHYELLYKMMPRDAIRKLRRGQTVIETFAEDVTIGFTDIVGFTHMTGTMQPVQVMTMLNELYTEFDTICERHSCYKVETIGDAYLVVGGAPSRCFCPMRAAETVALFLLDANDLVRRKYASKLQIRSGMASGPIVAGVVGTTMPRYCLFGDTVNVASRMESTSEPFQIQCSSRTRRLLLRSGTNNDNNNNSEYDFVLEERLNRRDGRHGTHVKGKGWKETWWVLGATRKSLSSSNNNNNHNAPKMFKLATTTNHDLEERIEEHPPKKKKTKTILASTYSGTTTTTTTSFSSLSSLSSSSRMKGTTTTFTKDHWCHMPTTRHLSSDEIINRIYQVLHQRLQTLVSSRGEFLSKQADQELKSLVQQIASRYNPVHFHSLEHACHVTLSLDTILTGMMVANNNNSNDDDDDELLLLWSSPLACFAMVFAAYIHDVGHMGRSNAMLMKENHVLAKQYKDHTTSSIAEAHSIDLATELLLLPKYATLRRAIYDSTKDDNNNDDECFFFLIVRMAVLITDIASKTTQQHCKDLWMCAFGNNTTNTTNNNNTDHDHILATILESTQTRRRRPYHRTTSKVSFLKTCAILQHVIQVADIAHTTQGFETFVRWNYQLYQEWYEAGALLLGNDTNTDNNNWGSAQVSFLDGYVFPLIERWNTCCSSSSSNSRHHHHHNDDDCAGIVLSLAKEGRSIWEKEGDAITKLMKEGVTSSSSSGNTTTTEITITKILALLKDEKDMKEEFGSSSSDSELSV